MTRQAWNRGVEQDRIVLEHIRMLLLALAVLVERAAGLPVGRRLYLLAVLGIGEARARNLLVAMASDRCPVAPAGTGAAPTPAAGDAWLLAARFRMLALVVEAMLAQLGPRSLPRHAPASVRLPSRNLGLTAQSTPTPVPRATSPPVRVGDDMQLRR